MMHVSEMLVNTNIPCMKCSNLRRWDSFYRTLCMLHDTRRKAEHSVTLQQRFPPLCSRFLLVVNRPAVFLSFYHIECELFAVFIKYFVRQLKAFLPSFCHSCACEMSQGGAFDHLNGPQCGAFERHFGWGRGSLPRSRSQGFVTLSYLRACLHGVEDPGLVGLVSFVFTLWGTQNKRNLPHQTGFPTPCKQGLRTPAREVRGGGNLNNNFQKSQMPGGLPRGDVKASI